MTAKRMISMIIALAFLITLFAACGETNSSSIPSSSSGTPSLVSDATSGESGSSNEIDGEGYTVNFAYQVINEGVDQQKVNEAVDALAMDEINMHVNLLPMTMGTYNNQIPLMLASGDPLDILNVMSASFSSYIDSQYIINLADYLDCFQETVELFGEDAFAGYIGDFLVGFGMMKERGGPVCLVVRSDIFNELGFKADDFQITVEDYSSFDKLTELFQKVKEAYPDMWITDGAIGTLAALAYVDNLGSNFGVLENYGQSTMVTNYYESDQFRFFCELAKNWYDSGYVYEDVAISQDTGEMLMKAGNTFSFISAAKPNTKTEKLAQTGYDCEVILLGEPMKCTNSVVSGLWCIANCAEDKTKACQFLNWAYTSGEFNDLINWGIEGIDWVLNDDNQAEYPQGVDPSNVGYHNDLGWLYPNQFAGHAWAGNPVNIWDQYREYNNNSLKSLAFGFSYDSRPVSNEIAQLTNVENQYLKNVSCGIVDDVDAALSEFNQALYDAGLQTVIDDKQGQLDAWLAKQD